MTRLSVIIPTLNEASEIGATLHSLRALRQRGCEVIVVDGGSKDATRELAQSDADRVLTSAAGRATQMNAGAHAATGDVLLFLHADTRLPAHADQLILEGLVSTSRVWGRFDVRIASTQQALRLVGAMMNLRSRLTRICTGDQAIFVRSDAFFAVGAYPDQELMEDIELSGRLRRLSPPLCLGARCSTSARRWETRGIARTIALMWWLRLQYACGVPAAKLARAYRRGRH